MKKLMISAFVLLMASCMQAPQTDLEGLKATIDVSQSAFDARDPTAIAAIYAEDGAVMSPNSETVTGQAAIEDFWMEVLASGIDLGVAKTTNLYAHGDVGYEVGTYAVTDPDGDVDEGKYVRIWRHGDGKWQLQHVTWNSNLPLTAPETSIRASDSDRLDEILAAQSEQARARYKYRSPRETLEFLGIEPGMTVIESLPGGGWYTRILLPYLGADGRLIGVDYSLDLTSSFEDTTDEDIAEAKAWVETWPAEAESWRTDDSAEVSAYFHGSLPESMHGTADAVLFIRALHGMASSESEGGYMSEALRESFDALKPGGLVGIVQHHARENMSDDWAQGENGYLKKGYVIDMMEAAGFELAADSDMHANSKDQPATEDFVWRLPPSLNTSEDDPELRAQMQAIGESNRMTLKFRKP